MIVFHTLLINLLSYTIVVDFIWHWYGGGSGWHNVQLTLIFMRHASCRAWSFLVSKVRRSDVDSVQVWIHSLLNLSALVYCMALHIKGIWQLASFLCVMRLCLFHSRDTKPGVCQCQVHAWYLSYIETIKIDAYCYQSIHFQIALHGGANLRLFRCTIFCLIDSFS